MFEDFEEKREQLIRFNVEEVIYITSFFVSLDSNSGSFAYMS